MLNRKLFMGITIFFVAITACNKIKDNEFSPMAPTHTYDTTTVERIEARQLIPGEPLLFIYYFYYDANYRITSSVLTFRNSFGSLQDTARYKKYFYNGNDSLPYKLIYGINEHYYPGSYFRDTGYLFYDAQHRLIKDSGYTFNYPGFGPGTATYSKRTKTFNYITSDSLTATSVYQSLWGATTTNTYNIGVKNINTGTQKIQKVYNPLAGLAYVYTAAYDTFKNPLAKALPQMAPYYNPDGHGYGDGEFALQFPEPYNRTYINVQASGPSFNNKFDSLAYTYNTQGLPQQVIVTSHLLTPSTNPPVKLTFYY